MCCRSIVLMLLLMAIVAPPLRAQPEAPAAPRMAEGIGITIERTGPQKVIIPSGQHGLVGFPDEGITFLSRKPLSFLLVAGVSTRLMQGSSLATAKPVAEVIAPAPGGPDNGYAGVSAAITDPNDGTIRAFYHAEDWEGYEKLGLNGVNNFLASVCLATCPADGKVFTKQGPVITGPDAKDASSKHPQGIGTASVTVTPGGKYLLAWFTVYSPAPGRGSEIGMARAAAASGGEAGSWWKWRDTDFSEPGIGGRGTPVISFRERKGAAMDASVVWVPECRRYVMVFTGVIHGDTAPDSDPQGGIWVTCSREGIAWSEPTRIVKGIGVPCTGRECTMHPSLVVNSATADTIDATLLYGYSPSWGMTVEAPSHHLVGRTVGLKMTDGE